MPCNLSSVLGRLRMRRPVAWNAAFAIAEEHMPISPIPTRPRRIENAIVFSDEINVDDAKVRVDRHVIRREFAWRSAGSTRRACFLHGRREVTAWPRATTDITARQPAHAAHGSQSSADVQLDYLHAIFKRSSLREPASISSQSCGVSSS